MEVNTSRKDSRAYLIKVTGDSAPFKTTKQEMEQTHNALVYSIRARSEKHTMALYILQYCKVYCRYCTVEFV